jgi:hypothetical protein
MLAGRLLAGALGLLRSTLDVRRVVSRNSQTIVLERNNRLKCSEATMFTRSKKLQHTVVHACETRRLSFVTFCP